MNADAINGTFELIGAAVLWMNVISIRRDKTVQGFDPRTTVFFTSWGFWNLYYYPSLDQWLSFWGGIAIVTVNLIWLCHVLYYWAEAKARRNAVIRFAKLLEKAHGESIDAFDSKGNIIDFKTEKDKHET